MRAFLLAVVCSALLTACSRDRASSVSFEVGSSRVIAAKNLEQIHATVLSDSPERLLAEFRAPDMKRPMQVELLFTNEILKSVNYSPQ